VAQEGMTKKQLAFVRKALPTASTLAAIDMPYTSGMRRLPLSTSSNAWTGRRTVAQTRHLDEESSRVHKATGLPLTQCRSAIREGRDPQEMIDAFKGNDPYRRRTDEELHEALRSKTDEQ